VGQLIRAHESSLDIGKANAAGLDVRNLMKSPMHGEGRVARSFVNLGHSARISSLVLMFN